jgi:hypothetical protein
MTFAGGSHKRATGRVDLATDERVVITEVFQSSPGGHNATATSEQ